MTYVLGFFGLLSMFVAEAFYSSDFKKSFKKPEFLKRNLSYMLASLVVLVSLGQIGLLLKGKIPVLIGGLPPLADYLGVFALAELLNWLFHYAKHQGYLWRFHYQHHLDERYTSLLTTHTHGLEVIFSGSIITCIMILVGFSQEALNSYYLFYSLANTYQHLSFKISLGPLDWLIVSPAYHRFHHSKTMRTNYGSTLTLWDIVFRTARWPKRGEFHSDVGIDARTEPFGFLPELLFFLPKFPKITPALEGKSESQEA